MDKQQQYTNTNLQTKDEYVDFHVGKYDLFFKKGYRILYLINDVLLGVWFFVGSILFYFEGLQTWGISLFVLGSIQMLIRPSIRLIHQIHVKKHYKKQYHKEKSVEH